MQTPLQKFCSTVHGVLICQVSSCNLFTFRSLHIRGPITVYRTLLCSNTGHFLCPPLSLTKPIPVCSMQIGLKCTYLVLLWDFCSFTVVCTVAAALKLTFMGIHFGMWWTKKVAERFVTNKHHCFLCKERFRKAHSHSRQWINELQRPFQGMLSSFLLRMQPLTWN